MANKKKRTKKHQGMKKPSAKPKVLASKDAKEKFKVKDNRKQAQPQVSDHRPKDAQHLRRGDR